MIKKHLIMIKKHSMNEFMIKKHLMKSVSYRIRNTFHD